MLAIGGADLLEEACAVFVAGIGMIAGFSSIVSAFG
jgi:hypothetical protein